MVRSTTLAQIQTGCRSNSAGDTATPKSRCCLGTVPYQAALYGVALLSFSLTVLYCSGVHGTVVSVACAMVHDCGMFKEPFEPSASAVREASFAALEYLAPFNGWCQ